LPITIDLGKLSLRRMTGELGSVPLGGNSFLWKKIVSHQGTEGKRGKGGNDYNEDREMDARLSSGLSQKPGLKGVKKLKRRKNNNTNERKGGALQ